MPHTGTKKSQSVPQTSLTRSTTESLRLPHINSAPFCALRGWIQAQQPTLWLLIEGRDTVQRFRATSTRGPLSPNG